MGLDNYASHSPEGVALTDEDKRAFFGAGIHLCGGVFSGNDGSFRGKVYLDVVLEVTGVSLVSEWLPPETVREMAEKLNSITAEALAEANDFARSRPRATPTSVNEMMSLQCFFTICANRDLGLVGWS